jgi:quercetin dioxygenase-like cupin family protein
MRRITATAALVTLLPLSVCVSGAIAKNLASIPVFEANTTTVAGNGASQPVRVSVQSWELSGPQGATHEIPVQGFYVAHLLSGSIATTIDGQTTTPPPGAYWTVKAGATMQVKVLGEFAVLETIVVSKQ